MSRRYPAGFIRPGYNPLEVPDAPTIGTATAGDSSASVTFTAPSDTGGGAITGYGARGVNTSNNTTVSATGSSSTRGVFGGGNTGSLVNTIDYVIIASAGNATDFGDLNGVRADLSACSSTTRGIFAGGFDGSSFLNVIQYVTIASAGNATDFGDLTYDVYELAACSSDHGGLS